MPGNQAVKSTARAILGKKWPQFVCCTFLLLAGVFVGLYAQNVFFLILGDMAPIASVPFIIFYSFLIFCPLFLGVLRYAWRTGINENESITSVFHYFEDAGSYLKSVHFAFSFGVRIILSAFLAYLPYIALYAVHRIMGGFADGGTEMHIMFLSAILSIFGLVMFIVFSVRYYMAPLLFVGSERLEVAETLHLSSLVSRKTAGAYIVLILGMIGWIFLSVLGITLIYTVPYILVAYTVHCRYAVYYYNSRIKLAKETDFPEFRSSF